MSDAGDRIKKAYDAVTPSDEAKQRMLAAIMAAAPQVQEGTAQDAPLRAVEGGRARRALGRLAPGLSIAACLLAVVGVGIRLSDIGPAALDSDVQILSASREGGDPVETPAPAADEPAALAYEEACEAAGRQDADADAGESARAARLCVEEPYLSGELGFFVCTGQVLRPEEVGPQVGDAAYYRNGFYTRQGATVPVHEVLDFDPSEVVAIEDPANPGSWLAFAAQQ